MEDLLWFLGELIFDVIIYGVPELFVETGTRKAKSRNPDLSVPPLMSGLLYAIAGYIIGIVSVHFFPNHLISNETIRTVNLFLVPIIIGVLMTSLGRWLKARGKVTVGLDSFGRAFLFAFCIAFARFGFAR